MRELFNKIPEPWNYVAMVGAILVLIVAAWIMTRVNKRVFKRIKKSKNSIHIAFLEKLNVAVIIIACIILAFSAVDGATSIWRTLLGGTAIISAVLAFAAQDVIKDILAGLMISVHKPFGI